MTLEQREYLRARIKALPVDWWKHPGACFKLPELFCRHMLGLHLLFERDGRLEQEFFTGF